MDILVLLLTALCVRGIQGLPNGPPPTACTTLSPDPASHGAEAQDTPSPYQVDLSSLDEQGTGNFSYTPGKSYQLSIFSVAGRSFRGVMLQGRLLADDTTPAGTFTVTDTSTSLSLCSPPNISVVHNSRAMKSSITTTWTAPAMGTGPLRIGFSVVMARTVYWANLRTAVIFERGLIVSPPRQDPLLPFGESAGDFSLQSTLDGSSQPLSVPAVSGFPFLGAAEDTIYVNANGVISFGSDFGSFLQERFPLSINSKLVAPFWADHNNGIAGHIWYRYSKEQSLLGEVGANVSASFHTSFSPTLLFIATWEGVAQHLGEPENVNTYQAVIATDGEQTYVLLLYRDIQWERNFNDRVANVGFSVTDSARQYGFNLFDFIAAGSPIDLPNLSNVGIPGVFHFRVDQDAVMLPQELATDELLLPFGESFGDSIIASSLEGSLPLRNFSSSSFLFFGTEEDTIFVNTNGVLSFRQPFDTSTPQPFPLAGDEILLAPFWDGHDILQGGRILYRFSTEPSLLSRVGERVGDAFELTFAPNLLFVVTWDDVAQFISSESGAGPDDEDGDVYDGGSGPTNVPTSVTGAGPDDEDGDVYDSGSGPTTIPPPVPVNTYQAVLATDGSTSFILFLYQSIQWDTTSTSIGFNAGDEIGGFNLPRPSGGNFLNLDTTSNVGIPGMFIFRSDTDQILQPGEPTATDPIATTATPAPQTRGHLLPFGFTAGDQLVPPSVDGPSPLLPIPGGPLPFYGAQHSVIYVNSNGVLSFGVPFSDFGPEPFPLDDEQPDVLIALYWHDHDVNVAGQIFYRFSEEQALLSEVGTNISTAFGVIFSPSLLFVATWDMVSRYRGVTETIELEVNTYQVIIATDRLSTYVLFLYDDIQFGNSFTTIGFNAGDGQRGFNLATFLHGGLDGLVDSSNAELTGVYFFRVDQNDILQPGDPPSTPSVVTPTTTAPPPPLDNLFPHGTSEGDLLLLRTLDGSSPPLNFSVPVNFFGEGEETIYVNTNGVLSFGESFNNFMASPFPLSGSDRLIALYWDDHDVRQGTGQIAYRFSQDPELLAQVGVIVNESFAVEFSAEVVFIATWSTVQRFNLPSQENTYQVVLATDGSATYVLFLYSSVQWSSDATVIGFNAGDGVRGLNLTSPGDFTTIEGTSNVNRTGTFVFRVDQDSVLQPGDIIEEDPIIEFEQMMYEVLEDIGEENLALRVCISVLELPSERSVTLKTVSGTARGGEDYVELNREMVLSFGNQRRCVGIIILEDSITEEDETFQVVIEGLDASTIVTIRDDDFTIRYVGNSPVVTDKTVTFNLSLGHNTQAAKCALLIGTRVQNETDCSNGMASFSLLQARNSEYTPRIILTRKDQADTVLVNTSRNLRLGVRSRCSVHLINDGITTTNTADGGVVTIIEWGLSAPSHVIQSQVAFTCSLDGGTTFNCASPLQLNFGVGTRTLAVLPSQTGGCLFSIQRRFHL